MDSYDHINETVISRSGFDCLGSYDPPTRRQLDVLPRHSHTLSYSLVINGPNVTGFETITYSCNNYV